MLGLAAGVLVVASTHSFCFTLAAERMCQRIRRKYFEALLRQGLPFYDARDATELATNFSGALPKMEVALGINWGALLQSSAQVVGGLTVGLVWAWKVGLTMIACIPFLAIGAGGGARALRSRETNASKKIGMASSFVDEICALKRTVVALNTQEKELARFGSEMASVYSTDLTAALRETKFLALYNSALGTAMAMSFYVGYQMVINDEIESGDVTTAFFAIIIAGVSFGEIIPALSSIAIGRTSAHACFAAIDAAIEIDNLSEAGIKPAERLSGLIDFSNVDFKYPTRPDEAVLNKISFTIAPMTTVAIVGSSGSGKSTIISLIERFYSHQDGAITLDGTPIGEYNIQWLRQQIALVSQSPRLFPGTVFENIAMAKDGATTAQVHAAARLAAAHDFITAMPDGYETSLVDGGQLSGGQRQRIAIARALIKEPAVLLLDEATSALDSKSELEVQAALNAARSGRTTIVVAHRLSTVADADRIIVMEAGAVVETGTHTELMAKQGHYYSMVLLQDSSAGVGRTSGGDATEELTAGDGRSKQESAGDSAAVIAGIETTVPEKKATVDTAAPASKKEKKANAAALAVLTAPDWWINKGAFFGGLMHGYSYPGYGLCVAQMMGALATRDTAAADYWTSMFGVHIALGFLGAFIGGICAGYSGARISCRLRTLCFQKILGKQVAWHDLEQNNRSTLVQRITRDCRQVRYAASDKLLSRGKACGALGGALALAFIHCFRIALVTIGCIPFLVSGGILRQRAVRLASGQESFKYSEVFAADSIKNIHTVISIGAISKFLGKYSDLLHEPEIKTVRFAPIRGLMLGAGMAAIFAAFALNLWFSAVNVNKGWCTLADSTTALLCVIFGGVRSGAFLGEAPDKNAGIKAAELVQKLLTDNELDTPASGALGTAAKPITTAGKIEFKNVSFSYPSRPDAPVLDSFSMTINPGEMVALVGLSGSGKSTIMSLLNQFYTQNSGQILVDGADLSLYATSHLRQAVGLVDQEPHLFSTTVANNVAYGTPGSVSDDEPAIWGALESANAKDFVGELSDGLQTHVGKFGSKLSGGQRQRVVISRLFIRGDKVKVLLLDEATSALDSKSEQLVQEGIERLRQGKTTLVIAHRLSTVQAADRIIVLNEGKVLEQGTHQELYDARAAYFQLVQNQMIGRRPNAVTPADLQTSTTA